MANATKIILTTRFRVVAERRSLNATRIQETCKEVSHAFFAEGQHSR